MRRNGKSTLLKHQCDFDAFYNLAKPSQRRLFEQNPDILADEIKALDRKTTKKQLVVVIDEVQKVPELMDVAQYIIDDKLDIYFEGRLNINL